MGRNNGDMSLFSFFDAEEKALADAFLTNGYVVCPVEDRTALERIRGRVAALAAEQLSLDLPADPGAFLNRIHEKIGPDRLNDFRLAILDGINAESWLRSAYFALARRALGAIVGNELAMQRRVNLSIQLPYDESSLLPVHADVWSGDSPFEAVLWLPLVDCRRTKSMYLMPLEPDRAIQVRLGEFARLSAEDIFQSIAQDVVFLDVPYGSILVFCQNLMHGNRINEERETRWSMNCRFKGLLTPYADKRLGEFFEPITLRPATRLGAAYRLPSGFDG